MASQINRLRRMDPKRTLFLLCDIQEKFQPGMPLFNSMVNNAKKLVAAGKVLKVPLICTEHYPEKLGKLVPDINVDHANAVLKKTKFSMMTPEMEVKIKEIFDGKPNDVVLFGLESHICVEQTAMDLIERNINVFLVADCVCSRLTQDRDLAIERLRQIGCIVTTSESVIFNLMDNKNHPAFNEVRKFVANPSMDMQLSIVPTVNKL